MKTRGFQLQKIEDHTFQDNPQINEIIQLKQKLSKSKKPRLSRRGTQSINQSHNSRTDAGNEKKLLSL